MILDALNQLSDSQAATTNATTVTQRSIDLGNTTPKRNLDGEPMALAFFIEAITASADTFTFQAITTTAEDLTGSVLVIVRSRAFAAATIPVGSVVALPIPPGTPTQRFLGGSTILGASDALTHSCYLVPLSFLNKLQNYATNIVIS